MPGAVVTQINTAVVAEQQERCLHLRVRGWPIRAIAKEVGLSHGTVENRIKAAINERLDVPTAELIKLELEKLDYAVSRLMPKVDAGEETAIALYLKVNESRRRLLGLDAAIKVDATVTETTQADLEIRDMVMAARARETLDA